MLLQLPESEVPYYFLLYAGMPEHISCHSLRKTFGYHAWKQSVPPAMLMDIYNHSSYQITKRYLGIDQDDKDQVFEKIRQVKVSVIYYSVY